MTRFPLRSSAGRSLAVAVALAALLLPVAGCGNDFGLGENHVNRPDVIQFSPLISPLDFFTLQQNPTFTDGGLTVSTHPAYPGEVVIFFNDTELDPASIFTGGDPNLGIDPSSLLVLQFIPGTGNVTLPLAGVIVETDRIRCLPSALWLRDPILGTFSPIFGGALADGQYSIEVKENIKNSAGKPLLDAPVFQAFTVGAADAVAPFVVTTTPVNNEEDVGAGTPPPQPQGAQGVADIRTNIFGPTSPDIIVQFNEPISNTSVSVNNFSVVDAGAFVPGGGAPPQVPPAPGFPKLRSVDQGDTLPSNGHEIIWRPDPAFGGFPFGTTIQVTVVGLDPDPVTGTPANAAPIKDLAGNGMTDSFVFSFRTLAPPDLPQNPFPEYAIYWSSTDRIGALDAINQQGLADEFLVPGTFTDGVPRNVVPEFTDTVANSQNISNFDPTEISVDGRTNGATCHSFIYVLSPSTSEVVIVNTRTSIPVAIVSTPAPGGISNQTGGGQAQNILVVTNSSANTLTVFGIQGIVPGRSFLSGAITLQKTTTTGNTPRAVSISLSPTGLWNRDPGFGGPAVPLIIYADFTDGVVNTKPLNSDAPVRQFNLGQSSAPNDVSMTPCYSPCVGCPVIMYTAISQGGSGPNAGKIAYYVAGPGCSTGSTTPIRPDAIVGDVGGLDGCAGLDDVFPLATPAYFVVAESGSQANGISTITRVVGNVNLPGSPEINSQYHQIGANPTSVAHRAAWQNPLIGVAGSATCYFPPPPAGCVYNGTEQCLVAVDGSLGVSQDLYVCARGAGLIQIVDINSGFRDAFSPVFIPGVRFVGSHASQ